MTIEARLEALTIAIQALTSALTQRTPQVSAPTVVAAPAPDPVPTPAPAPMMPPPPMFAAPPAPVTPAVPFSDAKGLMDYVMSRYKALGPEKGARIHGVLLSLGVQNINDVKPEQYPALFAGVEGIA